MHKLLILSSEPLDPFVRRLEQDGFDVVLQPPGAEATASGNPDLILINLAAAGEDAAVKQLLQGTPKEDGPAIIALLTPDQLPSLDSALGLDDFLLASADPAELAARVRQALWKRSGLDTENTIRCGDLVMDLANYTVQIAGRPVELTYKEYELLRFLASNRDRVFNRETLLNKVWGYDFYGGARTVDVHIRRLRAKIEDRHHTFIETVRNVGYRFRALP